MSASAQLERPVGSARGGDAPGFPAGGKAAPAVRHSIAGAFAAMDAHAVAVHQERCAKVRNRNVACLKCADACTTGCISVVDGELVIDAARCVGCGTCATVCPTCALEARHPSDAALLASCEKAMRGGVVTIVCAQYALALGDLAERRAFGEVVCLGRVDEALVAQLVARGAREVRLLCGACDRCEQRYGRSTAELVADTATTLLGAWGSDAQVRVSSELSADLLADGEMAAEAAARLEARFAHGCGNPRISEVAEAYADGTEADPLFSVTFEAANFQMPHVMADGTLPHFLPDRRERLLDALAELGDPQTDAISTRLWGCVVIDGTKCSACRMCATFCPTGAIRKFDEADGTFGVEHFPGDCVKCMSCHDICPEHAISVLDTVRAEYLVDGTVHRYTMRDKPLDDSSHQILERMTPQIEGDVFER